MGHETSSKRRVKCPIKEGEALDKVVRRYQRKRDKTAISQQSASSKARRSTRKQQRISDYYHQRTRITNEGDYIKNQLDKEHATKDAAMKHVMEGLRSYVDCDGAVASTSIEADIRDAAIRVRRTKEAKTAWTEYQIKYEILKYQK